MNKPELTVEEIERIRFDYGQSGIVLHGRFHRLCDMALRTARDAALSPDEANREVIQGTVGRELEGWGTPSTCPICGFDAGECGGHDDETVARNTPDAPPIDPVTVERCAQEAEGWRPDLNMENVGRWWATNEIATAIRALTTKGRAALGEPE